MAPGEADARARRADQARALRPAPLSMALILASLVAYLLVLRYAGLGLAAVLEREPDIHYALLRCGAKSNALIDEGEVFRLVACLFLHANLLHLALNLVGLYFVGRLAENVFGWRRTLVVFALAGVAGAFASYLASDALSVGASGALFGLTAALAAYFFRARRHLSPAARRLVVVGLPLVIAMSAGLGLLLPDIDNAAHGGGLLAGVLLGLSLHSPLLPGAGRPAPRLLAAATLATLVVLAGSAGLAVRAAARDLPPVDSSLGEAVIDGRAWPVPSRWQEGRLVARRCLPSDEAAEAGRDAPRCFSDPYDALLILGAPRRIFDGEEADGEAFADALAAHPGPAPPVEKRSDGETLFFVPAGQGMVYVLACYPELAERYRPLAEALHGALVLR